ncbi:MAG: alpha-galactosidase, partial [Clostridia bacterium]|nr:alpha-galactosidase [Clostridia bacterium]
PDDFRLKEDFLPLGAKIKFSSSGGRSCQPVMPFQSLRLDNEVEIIAIGWTGNWFSEYERTAEGVHLRCGVSEVETYLKPGEKIRTAQILRMRCSEGPDTARNRFRRLIRTHYTPSAVRDHDEGRFCMTFWGGINSDSIVQRLQKACKEELPFDFAWMDAAWYGYSAVPCPNDHTGEWYGRAGDWTVNKNFHPNDLEDVVKASEESGMRFMLWFEPERASKGTDWPTAHPDYFLNSPYPGDNNILLNLGNKEAREFCTEQISAFIEKLHLGCYRQDFNMDPLAFWQSADEPYRKGMTEIKYVMGLYDFYDSLLERFPDLLIDNCASGGRRIDIEMLSRSLAMWRTDYSCEWDADPEMIQGQQGSISNWIPYSGACSGRVTLTDYAVRSGCGSSYVFNYWGFEDNNMDDSEQSKELYGWVRRIGKEYHKLSSYFGYDYYPLIKPDFEKNTWTAWQYDRPEKNDGVIVVFRKSQSQMCAADLNPGGADADSIYEFESDTGKQFTLTGKELLEKGLHVELSEKGTSMILYYKKYKTV